MSLFHKTHTLERSSHTLLLLWMALPSVLLSACTLEFNDFDPFTKPGAYGGEPATDDMMVDPEEDLGIDMDPILDMEIDMLPPVSDTDGDGVLDDVDNCIDIVNPEQQDSDGNGVGDLCDDGDMDGVIDYRVNNEGEIIPSDNCLGVPNADQLNRDWDDLGDACDDDIDGDGVSNDLEVQNGTRPDLADSDLDGYLDGEDLCPNVPSRGIDQDGDGLGDACDLDDDGDGIYDWIDACPQIADPEQTANPEEAAAGRGSACAGDFDQDGLSDSEDPCPLSPFNDVNSRFYCHSSLRFHGYDADIYDLELTESALWAASRGGLSRFELDESGDPIAESESRYGQEFGLWSPYVKSLSPLSVTGPNALRIQGRWVVNGGRLSALRYEGESGEYIAYEQDLSSEGVSEVFDVVGHSGGAIIATDYGLFSLSYNSLTSLPVGMMMTPRIESLYYDREASLVWFTVNQTLFSLDLSDELSIQERYTFDSVNTISRVRRDHLSQESHLLILLSDQELIYYDVVNNTEAYPRAQIKAYDVINRPLGDYIATEEGITAASPSSTPSTPAYKAPKSNKSRVLVSKPNGGVLIGSASNASGSSRADGLGSRGGISSGGGLWLNIPIEGQSCIIDAHLSDSGTLWFATPNGLYKRSSSGEQNLVIEEPIYALSANNDTLWVSTDRSVYRVNLNSEDPPVSYPLTTITAPFTAIYATSSTLWVGGANGVAKATIDELTGTPGEWSEFLANDVVGLPAGEVVSFGYQGTTTWIAVSGPEGGVARYDDGFNELVYEQNVLPSTQITDLYVSDQRVVVTTTIGVSIFKPVIQNVDDIVTLYARQGIPAEAGTGHVLSAIDNGQRLWMYTKPTMNTPYGGLVSIEIDDPAQPLRSVGSERFYGLAQLDIKKSSLPEGILDGRSRVRFSSFNTPTNGLILSTCGDEQSPGGVAILDQYRGIERHIEERALVGASEGTLLPSPRGHVMMATAFGDLSYNEAEGVNGPGELLTQDLYTPLLEGEEWPSNLDPVKISISSENLSAAIKSCRAYQQVGEAIKRLTCVLEDARIARHVVNNWVEEDSSLLDDPQLKINDFLLDPDNPVNTMWFATDRGLILVRTGQATVLTRENTAGKLPSDRVNSLSVNDNLRKLYIGTAAGLVVLDISTPVPAELSEVKMSPLSNESALLSGAISALYFNESQGLWIGGVGGAALYADGLLTKYPQGVQLPASPVTSIVSSGESTFFAHPAGVSVLKQGVMTHYGARDGVLPIKEKLLVDDRNVVWGQSELGVIAFPPSTSP